MPTYCEVLLFSIQKIDDLDHFGLVRKYLINCRAAINDLDRSIFLHARIKRKYSDQENAQHRLFYIDSSISKALNTILESKNVSDEVAFALDCAKDVAWALDFNNRSEFIYEFIEQHRLMIAEGAEIAFWCNFCYETMQVFNTNFNYKEDYDSPSERIIRHIEFPPEYAHAGMIVLNSFAKIVKEKYGSSGARVKIIQNSDKVTLIIETSEGQKHTIEETLKEVSKTLKTGGNLSQVIEDSSLRLQIEHNLEFATMQLRHEQERNELIKGRVDSLESMVSNLMNLVSDVVPKSIDATAMLAVVLSKTTDNFRAYIDELKEGKDNELAGLLDVIVERSSGDRTSEDAEAAKAALEGIKKRDFSLLVKLSEKFAEGAVSGGGREVFRWLLEIADKVSLPV